MVMTIVIWMRDANDQGVGVQGEVPEDHGRGRGERRAVVITKHGTPVAELVPAMRRPKSIVGALKGTGQILGDIVSPLDDIVWEAEVS